MDYLSPSFHFCLTQQDFPHGWVSRDTQTPSGDLSTTPLSFLSLPLSITPGNILRILQETELYHKSVGHIFLIFPKTLPEATEKLKLLIEFCKFPPLLEITEVGAVSAWIDDHARIPMARWNKSTQCSSERLHFPPRPIGHVFPSHCCRKRFERIKRLKIWDSIIDCSWLSNQICLAK